MKKICHGQYTNFISLHHTNQYNAIMTDLCNKPIVLLLSILFCQSIYKSIGMRKMSFLCNNLSIIQNMNFHSLKHTFPKSSYSSIMRAVNMIVLECYQFSFMRIPYNITMSLCMKAQMIVSLYFNFFVKKECWNKTFS